MGVLTNISVGLYPLLVPPPNSISMNIILCYHSNAFSLIVFPTHSVLDIYEKKTEKYTIVCIIPVNTAIICSNNTIAKFIFHVSRVT